MIKKKKFFNEVFLIEPNIHSDNRGCFYENFNKEKYHEIGLKGPWLQDNVSKTNYGGVRGLHFQNPKPQGKLVSVIFGSIFDVAVDIRKKSPTFGKWISAELNDKNCNQLWIPPGFAHGFQVLSKVAHVHYKCANNYWSPENEESILFNDKDIGINWPIEVSSISSKDKNAYHLNQIKSLPIYKNE